MGVARRLRLLVIPHYYSDYQRGRPADLAVCWGRRHEVYVIRQAVQPPGLGLWGKLRFHVASLRTQYRKEAGVTWVTLPALFKFRFLHRLWVRHAVRTLFRETPFDCVVNFSYWGEKAKPDAVGFELPHGGFRYIYDMLDDYVAGYQIYGQLGEAAIVDAYVREQMRRASAVVVTSLGMKELVRARYGRNDSAIIPNGYYEPSGFREAPDVARNLRRKWGWENRKVLGYVGSLDGWVDSQFLADVFHEYRKIDPSICLLVVGGGRRLEFLRKIFDDDPHVRMLGWIPSSRVEAYLTLLDVGLIPFEVDALTNRALPIKALEYLCWGKPVVASPLNELERLALPNVFLAETLPNGWAALISEILSGARPLLPYGEVMQVIRDYSWDRLAESYERLFDGNLTADMSSDG